jgi:hypothetical protein
MTGWDAPVSCKYQIRLISSKHRIFGTYFTQGGGGLILNESQLNGGERRREGTYTIHIYSLFCEQFVVHNLKNFLVALNMIHTLFAYSIYIFELLENAV